MVSKIFTWIIRFFTISSAISDAFEVFRARAGIKEIEDAETQGRIRKAVSPKTRKNNKKRPVSKPNTKTMVQKKEDSQITNTPTSNTSDKRKPGPGPNLG